MEAFLKSVYAKPPEKAVIDGALEVFATVSFQDKGQLVGMVDGDVEQLCMRDTPVPVKVLMRAVARLANAAHSAASSTASSSGSALQAPASCGAAQSQGAEREAATQAGRNTSHR